MQNAESSSGRVLKVGQRVFDRFYLKRALGEGGTGVVWLAHDRVLEQLVALKFLAEHLVHDPQAVERLKHETRRNLKLSHPNIVRIHDFLQDARSSAIMMEFVEGWSLWTMKVDKPHQIFTLPEITTWLRELFDALHYAHTQVGVVHRDIKPGNLMINARGQLKITDFGLARTIRRTAARDFVDPRVAGTDVYMSPQQWSGEEPTVADDIYSIGATIYELLTGKPPFYEGHIMDQVYEVVPPSLHHRLEHLGVPGVEIPAAYEETVAACLAKHPGDRPESVRAVAARLGLLEIVVLPSSDPSSGPASEPPISLKSSPERQFQPDSQDERALSEAAQVESSIFTGHQGVVMGIGLAMVLVLLGWLLAAQFFKSQSRGRISQLAASAPGFFPSDGQVWKNSIGMKFVPVPGLPVLFCVWETRVKDFTSFVNELGRAPSAKISSLDTTGKWRDLGHTWRDPEFAQGPEHPVVGLSVGDAVRFCDWLTIRERASGWINTNQSYRLPTSSEYFKAAGTNRFVWGDSWPPPKGAGNFAGEEIRALVPTFPFLSGYNDGFSGTAPVGSFASNPLGIFDLAGNVSEICSDRDPVDQLHRHFVVGGSWHEAAEAGLSLKNLGHVRDGGRSSDGGFRVILELHPSSNPVATE